MTGVASIVNGALKDESSVQLFYNTTTLNLGMVFRNGEAQGSDPKEGFEPSSIDRAGAIFNPSDIVAIQYNNTNWVFGITLPKPPADGNYTNYNVSVVSPIYMPLVSTEYGSDGLSNNRIAAASNGSSAWIYYLSSTGTNVAIKEWRFDQSTGSKLNGLTQVMPNSALSAYYNTVTGKRHIIYQSSEDKTLYDFSPQGNNVHVQPTSDANKGTTLATTFHKGKVWLYYTDSNNMIHCITGTGESWANARVLDEAPPIAPGGQLTVTSANGVNHLFYYQAGDKQSTHYRDFMPKSIE